jgi:hypothetical protein
MCSARLIHLIKSSVSNTELEYFASTLPPADRLNQKNQGRTENGIMNASGTLMNKSEALLVVSVLVCGHGTGIYQGTCRPLKQRPLLYS